MQRPAYQWDTNNFHPPTLPIMILNWQDFDSVFQQKPDYAPDQKTVENILRHRKEFGDELFFDRIWKSIGLTHRKDMENKFYSHLADLVQPRGRTTQRDRTKI